MSTRYRRSSPSDMASVTPERKPITSEYAGGVGPSLRISDEQRQDAVRAVTHSAAVEGWDLADTRQTLDMLGLLPVSPTKLTGPRSVICPTCAAVAGRPCTQNGGRDNYQRIHVARTKAAREAL